MLILRIKNILSCSWLISVLLDPYLFDTFVNLVSFLPSHYKDIFESAKCNWSHIQRVRRGKVIYEIIPPQLFLVIYFVDWGSYCNYCKYDMTGLDHVDISRQKRGSTNRNV